MSRTIQVAVLSTLFLFNAPSAFSQAPHHAQSRGELSFSDPILITPEEHLPVPIYIDAYFRDGRLYVSWALWEAEIYFSVIDVSTHERVLDTVFAGQSLFWDDDPNRDHGIAADSDGNIYVSYFSPAGYSTRKFSPQGDLLWERDVRGIFSPDTVQLAVGPDDGIWQLMGNGPREQFVKWDPQGNIQVPLTALANAGGGSLPGEAIDMHIDLHGSAHFSYRSTHGYLGDGTSSVTLYSQVDSMGAFVFDGLLVGEYDPPPTNLLGYRFSTVAVDASGQIHIMDNKSDRTYHSIISPQGQVELDHRRLGLAMELQMGDTDLSVDSTGQLWGVGDQTFAGPGGQEIDTIVGYYASDRWQRAGVIGDPNGFALGYSRIFMDGQDPVVFYSRIVDPTLVPVPRTQLLYSVTE